MLCSYLDDSIVAPSKCTVRGKTARDARSGQECMEAVAYSHTDLIVLVADLQSTERACWPGYPCDLIVSDSL